MAISVSGSLLVDDLDLIIQAALDGAGLACVAEDRVAPQLASGTLVRVLEDWCPPFPGFFLYYPSRKQQPAALAALIETFRLLTWPCCEAHKLVEARTSRNPGEPVNNRPFTLLLGSTRVENLPIMPDCSTETREVRRDSRDFAVRGSSCALAPSSPRR